MKRLIFAAAISLMIAGPAVAQVPPDIAAQIRKIGQIVDVPNTTKLYAPMFKDIKEAYASVKVERDIAYGPDPLNKLDVFTPTTGAAGRTVVIFAHGGGFERGDKVQKGAPFNDNLMLFLNQHGMVGVNINYRLAPRNHWPDAQQDMASAIRWVKANIGQYGGDPNRIVLWGVSAGASLIATYLSHPEFYGPDGVGVKGAVMHSGFYVNREPGSAYFGHDANELRQRSALDGMKKLNIPLMISHTEVDLPDAIVQAETANKELCAAGHCPAYAVYKDHSHVSQMYSIGTPDTSVSAPVVKFLTSIK
ncbi:MAG TPA: alpha/beta hydrolase [Micropepsaceae bacterium]|nr:alpha/beta hydrolase [Micropepsaceae bacterium]